MAGSPYATGTEVVDKTWNPSQAYNPYNNGVNGGAGTGSGTYDAQISAAHGVDPLAGFGNGQVQGASTVAAADPYSTYQHSILNSVNPSLNTIRNSASDATNSGYGKYNTGIQDFLASQGVSQNNINQESIQNELSKQQGYQGVLDMVGRGIQSGGVMLANKNAGDSSASGALARAYGTLGRQQQSGVNNQYLQGQNKISTDQSNFGIQQQAGVRDLAQNKSDIIDGIVQSASQQLSALDNTLVNASLPDRIAIEQEKQGIRDKAMASLGQLDQTLSSGVAGITPSSQESNQQQAFQMQNGGTAAANPFTFSNSAQTQLQNTGPFASTLPIFTFPGSKKQSA